MFKRLLLFVLIGLCVLPATATATDFRIPADMIGHWAVPALAQTYRWTSGYPDGTWRPDAPITRAELHTLLGRALNGGPSETPTPFVEQSHWSISQGWVPAALEEGILAAHEYPGNRFEPDRIVTRQELIIAALRATGHKDDAILGKSPVQLALDRNLIQGYPDGSIRVEAAATRAEALVVVARIMENRSRLVP